LSVQTSGTRTALQALSLDSLTGQSIDAIFLGLFDYVCPVGGRIDEGIARDAFVETIIALTENQISDLDNLSADQIHTVLELYISYSISARICNDIGTKVIEISRDQQTVAQVQTQLQEFIRRGVSDALTNARDRFLSIDQNTVHDYVNQVYDQTFELLQMMGETEARNR